MEICQSRHVVPPAQGDEAQSHASCQRVALPVAACAADLRLQFLHQAARVRCWRKQQDGGKVDHDHRLSAQAVSFGMPCLHCLMAEMGTTPDPATSACLKMQHLPASMTRQGEAYPAVPDDMDQILASDS